VAGLFDKGPKDNEKDARDGEDCVDIREARLARSSPSPSSLGTYRRRADLRRRIGFRIVVLQTNNKQLDGFKKACLPHADQHSFLDVSKGEDASDERARRAFPDVEAIFPISGIPFVIL